MKKIGILHGMENSFPPAFVDRINAMNVPGVKAEAVRIDKVIQGVSLGYDVIVDRISQDVPYYRALLKKRCHHRYCRYQQSILVECG